MRVALGPCQSSGRGLWFPFCRQEPEARKGAGTCPRFHTRRGWSRAGLHPSLWPALMGSPFSSAEFQKEAEPEGKKKGKFKTMKVLKLLGNKRDTKSKSPGDKS